MRPLQYVLAATLAVMLLAGSGTIIPGQEVAQVEAQTGWYDDIAAAAAYYGIPEQTDYLYSVMLCESGGDPNAVNPRTGDTGLFQYQPSTYYAFGGTNIWDPHEQIMVTAWAFSQGLQYHWVCA